MAYFDSKNIENSCTIKLSDDLTTLIRCELVPFYGEYKCEIPSSVTTIEDSAFRCCDRLAFVSIPESVTSIGDEAFARCTSLKSIVIPNSVTHIGRLAFSGCTSLTSIIIPNRVTSIGDGAFGECDRLTSVVWNAKKCADFSNFSPFPNSIKSFTFGESVEHIPAYLCYGMKDLTTITIPNSVASIGVHAFWGCDDLNTIDVKSENQSFISHDGVMFNKDITRLIKYPSRKEGGYIIPDGVVHIDNCAFEGCSSLSSVKIPNSVATIGGGAFAGCYSLTSIAIPDSVKSIGADAFGGCTRLTSVTIPNSVATIGGGAFYNCKNLTSIIIPYGVTVIESSTFENCSKLTSVTIPNSVATIGNSAFAGCISLTSITIPNSIAFIGYGAFSGCHLLSISIPNGVKSIGEEAFCSCEYLTSISIPDSVTSIGDRAFCYCNSLKIVSIPNSITEIGSCVFEECCNLASIDIPDSVTSIGEQTFLGCVNLKSVVIPSAVKSMGYDVFGGCTNLTSVIWNAKRCADYIFPDFILDFQPFPDTVKSFTFGESVEHIPAYLCYGLKELSSVILPKSVTSIGVEAFRGCGNLEYINVEKDNIRYSSIDGILFNSDKTKLIKYPEGKKESEYSIPNSVTSIGDDAFNGCNGLHTIIIPSSVMKIGERAFWSGNLRALIVPNGQKERFAQMATIDEYNEIIIKEKTKIDIKEWMQKYHNLLGRIEQARQSIEEGTLVEPKEKKDFLKLPEEYKIAFYYHNKTNLIPPRGLEMPIEIFRDCLSKDSNYVLPIYTWCATGKEIHELARMDGDINGLIPSKGYYKIVGVEEGDTVIYQAYYNYREPQFAEFESQIVRICQKPFCSESSLLQEMDSNISVGNIVHVKQQTKLIIIPKDEKPYLAYKVIWEKVDAKNY